MTNSTVEAWYVERHGRKIEDNGGGSVSYLLNACVYETDTDGEDGRIAILLGPATNEDYIEAGIKRRVPMVAVTGHDYESAILPDYYE